MGNGAPGQAIAIVGIGCRFPGHANSPEALWKLLASGVDAITEIPRARSDVESVFDPDPSRLGKSYVRWAGMADFVDAFDAAFFGVSPREAVRMDPQQRMLLEVAWEAFEDGGQRADLLAGSRTGVFIGISTHDYGTLQYGPRSRADLDAHSATGTASSIAANRISYTFDLKGPSLAVDTACSSSLTAVHLATRSLAADECDLAIAGGVNAIILPEVFIGYSRASMLAPDGRSKAFDARANGFVRGEGAGLVVLKPLDRAIADRDPIHAVILGSAINQDGHTSGIMVPSRESQRDMLRAALKEAGIDRLDVQYVEAHGTGTAVGDPLEAAAIGEVLGPRPEDAPCWIGSIKTNIGHLEAASGIAGLIKATLCLEHRQIPPSLHFLSPNPSIPFDALGLRVPTELIPWPRASRRAVAGVNSFGFGGANAHVVLGAAPERHSTRARPEVPPYLIAISAKSPTALLDLAQEYASRRGDQASLHDLSFTAAARRVHHEHRLAIVASTEAELVESIRGFVAGETAKTYAVGRVNRERGEPSIAFVYSGMGAQGWGMGRGMLGTDPVFREVIEASDAFLAPLAGWSLVDEIGRPESTSRLLRADIAMPASVAIQAALTASWKDLGVHPDAIIGHSAGEVAAAFAAGALSLNDALFIAFHRGRVSQLATGRGRMLAAALTPDEAERECARFGSRMVIGAINSPSSVTLSGDAGALAELASSLEAEGRFARFVSVEIPFHSPALDVFHDDLLESLAGIAPRPPAIPLVSATDASWVEGASLDADYWWRSFRRPVQFARAFDCLFDRSLDVFLEISAHPLLSVPIAECAKARGKEVLALASLRRNEDDRTTMLRALAQLHVRGHRIDWRWLFPSGGEAVPLPGYPWQREHHFYQPSERLARPGTDSGHPLLGDRLPTVQPTWIQSLDDPRLAFLADHKVGESTVHPAAAYIETALAAAGALRTSGQVVLDEIRFERALFVDSKSSVRVQLVLDPRTDRFEIHTANGADEKAATWVRNAAGRISRVEPIAAMNVDRAEIERRSPEEVDADALYGTLDRLGYRYGPRFRGIASARRGEREALVRIEAPAGISTVGYLAHPALLDALLQSMFAAVGGSPGCSILESTYLPVSIARVELHGPLPSAFWAHAILVRTDGEMLRGDVRAFDETGRSLIVIRGFSAKAIDESAVGAANTRTNDALYELRWEEAPTSIDGDRTSLFPSATEMARRVGRSAASEDTSAYYAVIEPELDAIARGFAREALSRLGWQAEADPDAIGVLPAHRRFFASLIEIAAPASDRAPEDHAARARRFGDAHPAYAPQVDLLARVGRSLAGIVKGHVDPREVLFGGGGTALMDAFYLGAPLATYNRLAAQAVAKAVEQGRGDPVASKRRILEIGAGTGATTRAVLSAIEPIDVEYAFTDVSPFFLARARDAFADRPWMTFSSLDIESSSAAESIVSRSFDVVLASNVVHATRDLRRTLANMFELLVPGGAVVLVEVTRRVAWADLIFGITDGWWRFEDEDLRPGHPLLPVDAWRTVLADAGFQDVALVADRDPSGALACVLMGTAPRRARRPVGSIIFSADRALGDRIRSGLVARGEEALLMRLEDQRTTASRTTREGPGEVEAFLEAEKARGRALPRIVYVFQRTFIEDEQMPASELMRIVLSNLERVRLLVRALEHHAGRVEVALVTIGAQSTAVDVGRTDLSVAPLIGLLRVAQSEYPSARWRAIDIDPALTDADVERAILELDRDGRETEVAIRAGKAYVPRLVRAAPIQLDRSPKLEPKRVRTDVAAVAVEIETAGALESLALFEAEIDPPKKGEIIIRVRATALNFRDLMLAMGMLKEDVDGFGPALGFECSGTVLECGPEVADVAPGDDVIAIGTRMLGTRAKSSVFTKKPTTLSFEDAATIPAGFMTAQYGLAHVGRLTRNERVLIHLATGGVGLAALQVARRIGAEIFATAGSDKKRAHLRSLGITHVFDSRSLAFADEIKNVTAGEGVDVVLNSLSGEAIDKGLSLLRPWGRFVEIGKRDILENTRIGLQPFVNSISLTAIDLFPIYRENAPLLKALLREVVDLSASGAFTPLPRTDFDLAQVEGALRFMSLARHIGKIVLTVRAPEYLVRPRARLTLKRNATYLITGGLGGFGLAVAGWMVERGARNVVLLSRGPEPSAANRAAFERLRRSPAQITVLVADVADEIALGRALSEIRGEMPPMRGIVHAPLVLDDAPIPALDRARFERVLAPKLAGAWNLHRLTLGDALDFFVLFSSAASVLGSPMQGNYASANTFLDALAHERRARKKPALAINWGALSGVGYVARNAQLGRGLLARGMGSLTPREALSILERLIEAESTQAVAMRLDWRLAKLESGFVSNRTAHLVAAAEANGGQGAETANQRPLIAEIERASMEERPKVVESHLRRRIARVMGTAEDRIDCDRPLGEMGFDSLLAVELMTALRIEFGVNMSVMQILEGASVKKIAALVLTDSGLLRG
jgi:acyl transferase domain-containing protein/NADPH:quinone reductase-like Zn-dependent oxidoreductase/NAD(P)-dependent dehydrogenase (short-subunit alcohol dehydrogenase family)/acyl carrier protein